MEKFENKILLLGNGLTAGRVADNLLANRKQLIVATPEKSLTFQPPSLADKKEHGQIELLTDTSIIDCKGASGDLKVQMRIGGKTVTRSFDRIIIAEDYRRSPVFTAYGLSPSPHVISLSQLLEKTATDVERENLSASGQRIVFLLGLLSESNPILTREAMQAALDRQQSGHQVYLLTGNLKVGAHGLEKLYRKTRDAGVLYFKFHKTRPRIRMKDGGQVIIEFADQLSRRSFRLSPDLTVVDEIIMPSESVRKLIRIFNLDADENGFAQADNVHRLDVLTNRKGILVAGPARDVLSEQDQLIDADNATLQAVVSDVTTEKDASIQAKIDPGNCVRCLTCYRLCPYRAVVVNARPRVQPEACEACGICVTECPRGAIQLEATPLASIQDRIKESIDFTQEKSFVPFITAFCCSRSAIQSYEFARRMYLMPKGLKVIEVPCAGGLAAEHLLNAFHHQADGVLVLTCHAGNCHSERGNTFAFERVDQTANLFDRIGFEKERLLVKTLASNMGMDFSEIVSAFEKTLIELGPSRLKKLK